MNWFYCSLTFGPLQIVEMLEVFSTSADKSMTLGDFEKMMVTARLA